MVGWKQSWQPAKGRAACVGQQTSNSMWFIHPSPVSGILNSWDWSDLILCLFSQVEGYWCWILLSLVLSWTTAVSLSKTNRLRCSDVLPAVSMQASNNLASSGVWGGCAVPFSGRLRDLFCPLWLKAMQHRKNSGQDGLSYCHRKDKPVSAGGTTSCFHVGTIEFWVYPKLQRIQVGFFFNGK